MTYQPPPGPAGPPAQDPGRTLGIVGLVFAFLCSLVGLILSIVAYTRSKNAGYKNTIALVGIIISVVGMIVGGIFGAMNYANMGR